MEKSSEDVADVIKGGGERWSGGRAVGRWRCWGSKVRKWLQAHLPVVLQLAHHHAAKLLVVALARVQKFANFGGACLLVGHQLVVLTHEQVTGQQRVQALV